MVSVLKKLSWFFKLNWKRYTLAISLLIFTGFIDVIPPWLIGYTIDGIHQDLLGQAEFNRILYGWIALTVVGYGITYIWHYNLFWGAFVLEKLLRSRLMGHFLRMTPTFYERNRTGDLMARSTNDLGAV